MTSWTTDLAAIAAGFDKATKQLLIDLQARGGWKGRRMTAGSHLRLQHISSGQQLTVAGTPGDRRGLLNTMARIKRAERS